MSAEANVTPLDRNLSPTSSQSTPATDGSGTYGFVLGSGSDVYESQDSNPSFLKDVTTFNVLAETPQRPQLSERPASPPPPRSFSQLEQEIKEWRQDSERTTLVLNSVSRDTFRELREDLRDLRPCRLYRSIKSLYISKLQRLELRKTSMLEYNASSEMGQVFMHELRVIGRRERVSSGTYDWDDSLAFEGAAAYACPEGEVDDDQDRKKSIIYMEPDGCFTPVNLRCRNPLTGLYDMILPTLVVLVGMDLKDEEVAKNVGRWFKKRKGLSSEVNSLINLSIRIESDTCLSFQLLVFGRPAHFSPDVPLVAPQLTLDPSYQLYARLQWKHELHTTPDIRQPLSFPPSVLWGIGNCPEAFPVNERITLSVKVLERYSFVQLLSLRNKVVARDYHPDI